MISVTSADQITVLRTVSEIEREFQFRYLDRLEFDDYELERWLRKKCHGAEQRDAIDTLQRWLGQLHGRELEKDPLLQNISLRWVCPEIGYGLFTQKAIKKWAYVGEYVGLVRQRALFYRNVNDYCFMYPRAWLGWWKPLTIDSERQGNLTRFINHSNTPNLESLSIYQGGIFRVIFRAITDIAPGVELCYDYGDLYWRKRKVYKPT